MKKTQVNDEISSQNSQLNIQDGEIEQWLDQWSNGDASVENKLIKALYPHIHTMAHFQLKSGSANAMQTTEIVNEAFIKLNDQKTVKWENKTHFLAITAKVIRAVIIDHYRAEYSQKRGGHEQHLTLERIEDFIKEPTTHDMNWLELDKLLSELNQIDSEAAQVVEYKVFGGMTIPEMAEALRVSESTVSRNWQFAKSWMLIQLT